MSFLGLFRPELRGGTVGTGAAVTGGSDSGCSVETELDEAAGGTINFFGSGAKEQAGKLESSRTTTLVKY
ncbi:MAG: hypothetical protein WCW67_01500 [Candidatus Margulisiibacteriota bacterium]|jgi:hypothetical protein